MRLDIQKALDKNKEVNKLFTTFGFKKNYERIGDYLRDDETVLYARNGNVKMNNNGDLKESGFSIKDKSPVIIVVTDKRVLIYFKVLLDEKLEQFPIGEIKSFDFKRNGLTSSIFRVTTLIKSVDIDLTCSAGEVKLLNNVLSELIS